MDQKELITSIKESFSTVFNERLKKIVLFGSEARNEAGPESDIDILVLLDEVKDFGSDLRICVDSIYLLSLEIDRRISVKPFSISEYEHTDIYYRHKYGDRFQNL
ncbi:MAG TPA: nucleotidyltransferase domain-containing protein [bacterium]|nr:nucleotidyltransferase domain-containing protein [bacterium]